MTTEAEIALNQELQMHRHLARPGLFIDIGAHTGDFTLAIAGVPGLDLVAIEPLSHAMAELQTRAALLGAAVRTFAVALSDRPGRMLLSVRGGGWSLRYYWVR